MFQRPFPKRLREPQSRVETVNVRGAWEGLGRRRRTKGIREVGMNSDWFCGSAGSSVFLTSTGLSLPPPLLQ